MYLMCGAKKEVMETPPQQHIPLASARAMQVLSLPNLMVDFSQKVGEDAYHPDKNPKGYIDLGMAENKLCEELTTQKVRSLDLLSKEESSLQYYFNLKGLTSFRQVLADFINRRFSPIRQIDPEQLFVSTGLTAILDILAFSLAEPGDYIMVPAPFYYRIKNDFWDRSGVKTLEVPLSAKDGFQVSVASFEIMYNLAKKEGKVIKALLLINPVNPLGDIYSPQLLIQLLHFAYKHGLHVISDEIYGLTTFEKDSKFRSILSLPLPDPQRVHFLWGFSKDFGLSGYRCGVLYSPNKPVMDYATAVGIFSATPALLQKRLQHLLSDNEWLDTVFFPTLRKRLSSLYKAACAKLCDMGVYVHPSEAGIFIWADFTPFLREQTWEAELELFKRFFEARVYVLPGKVNSCSTPGWFRIVFASSHHCVMEGLKRMESVLKSKSDTTIGTD